MANAKALCVNVIDKIRDHYDRPVIITSGFRSSSVNRVVGGSASSQHMRGQAVDFTVIGVTVDQLFDDIRKGVIKVPYDQLIHEFGSWVHISHNIAHNRKQSLRIAFQNGKAVTTIIK